MFTRLHDIEILTFRQLSTFAGITHFVTTRDANDSADPYSSFNICDYTYADSAAVADARQRLAEALNIASRAIVVPRQVHGDAVAEVTEAGWAGEADAIVTDRPGICLTVSTADCVPVLLYDPQRRAIAAVHAGWRGMAKRIISKTVAVMVARYGCEPAHIRAAIGPSISPEAFEVGAEVAAAFEEAGFPETVLPSAKAGKAHIDLWKAAASDLLSVGVDSGHIETAGICTWQYHDLFFSARRLGIRSGRISSGIMLK